MSSPVYIPRTKFNSSGKVGSTLNSWAIFLTQYFLLDIVMLQYLLVERLYEIKIKIIINFSKNNFSALYFIFFIIWWEQGNPRFSHRHWWKDKGTQKLDWQDSVWEWGKGLQGINILAAENLVIFPEEIRLISPPNRERVRTQMIQIHALIFTVTGIRRQNT